MGKSFNDLTRRNQLTGAGDDDVTRERVKRESVRRERYRARAAIRRGAWDALTNNRRRAVSVA
ncbi:hypothetical protein [Puerhibacterium puerhi]|uniref:hypothetical protein n=1 Tax=Puerhibacterium puerhi TaxID=2692623 RepID=UPI00135C54E1|nr:hypothetical protein [Puerhibacterium puerhi]